MVANKHWADFHRRFKATPPYKGYFEKLLQNVAEILLRPGSVVIDCGANVGKHTASFARFVGEGVRVIAVEPDPTTFKRISTRVEQHPKRERITLHNCAVGSSEGATIAFFSNAERPAVSSAVAPSAAPGETVTRIEVPCRTVDAICRDLDRVDFIKIDVEGLEFEVFKGAEQTIKQHRPYIFFENNREAGVRKGLYSQDDFLKFFDALGYDVLAGTGMKIDADTWRVFGPTNFFAFPSNARASGMEALLLANLLSMEPYLPAGEQGDAPARATPPARRPAMKGRAGA